MKTIIFQILIIPFFLLIESINWFSLLLDKIFYSSYKQIEIKSPVYISGMPRTASSLMHKLLSGDNERFTTMKLWEIAFAPSIVQKKVLIFLHKIDRYLRSPLKRSVQYFEIILLKKFDIRHPLRLSNIEEDEYLTVHNFTSALLIFFFPQVYKRLISNSKVGLFPNKKDNIHFYKDCIRKHLFVFGNDKTYLAKSPAHIIRYDVLVRNFPDMRMVGMLRIPHKAIPSTISLFQSFDEIFHSRLGSGMITNNTLLMADISYKNLADQHKKNSGDKFMLVRYIDFIENPENTILEIYKRFKYIVTDKFRRKLKLECIKQSSFYSRHTYSLEQYDLNLEQIRSRYEFIYRRYYDVHLTDA